MELPNEIRLKLEQALDLTHVKLTSYDFNGKGRILIGDSRYGVNLRALERAKLVYQIVILEALLREQADSMTPEAIREKAKRANGNNLYEIEFGKACEGIERIINKIRTDLFTQG